MILTIDLSLSSPSSSKNFQDASAERIEVIESSTEGGPVGGLANSRRTPGIASEDNFTRSICVTDVEEFGLRNRMVLSAMIA